MTDITLEPCPFCGDAEIIHITVNMSDDGCAKAYCPTCEYWTDGYVTDKGFLQWWNTRATHQKHPQVYDYMGENERLKAGIRLALMDFKRVDKDLRECDFRIEENSTRERIKFAIKNLQALTNKQD